MYMYEARPIAYMHAGNLKRHEVNVDINCETCIRSAQAEMTSGTWYKEIMTSDVLSPVVIASPSPHVSLDEGNTGLTGNDFDS